MTGDPSYYKTNKDKQYHDNNRIDNPNSIDNRQPSEQIATYEKTAIEETYEDYHNIPVNNDRFQSYNPTLPSTSAQYNMFVFPRMKTHINEFLY